MPYEIVKSTAGGKSGYRVKEKKKDGTIAYFSKKALPLKKAKAQRTAIIVSEIQRGKMERVEKNSQPLASLENYQKGGLVQNKRKIKSLPGKPKDFGDVVPAILEPGEVVIKVEDVPKVKKAVRKAKLKIKGL